MSTGGTEHGVHPARGPRRRWGDRARFVLERLLLRGLRYRLLLAASIVVGVALVAGGLIALLDPGLANLDEAVWWAFLRLTDPGYLGDDEGVARRSVSTILTVLGYVLFLGLLIAILTQWLNEVISRLESGLTPVALSDHVVVLGWNQRALTIVRELLSTRARVQRFLARRGVRSLRIVILAERVDALLHREVRERLGMLWNDRQVLLRAGDPLHLDHLERIAFRDAAVVILPGADFSERQPERLDARTIKTLLSVSRHASESGAVPPLAVAELYDARRASIARGAYAGPSEVIASYDIVSRLIAQSVLQSGLCGVFTELLSLEIGNAIYVRSAKPHAGARFGDLRTRFPRAIPLGTVHASDQRLALNPDPDATIDADDLLVFIARSFEDCAPDPGRADPAPAPTRAAVSERPTLQSRRLLILGWSRKVPRLLRELARYGEDVFEIDVVSSTALATRQEAFERDALQPPDHVRQIETGFTVPGVLESLEPWTYDNVILLASEWLDDEEQADAITVFAYLMLKRLLADRTDPPELFVELLDDENQFLFEDAQDDVIVSPLLVSYLVSQVALRRELSAIYAELSRPWGAQIVLQPARSYVRDDRPVRFAELDRAAAEHGEIALGLRRAGRALLNPDRDTEWTIEAGDEIVVLATHADPPPTS